MAAFLDELAKTLARPMPRSRAVRLVGGAIVAASVPSLALPKRAWSRAADCNAKGGGCIRTARCCYTSDGFAGSCCPWYFRCAPTGSGLCWDQYICEDGRGFCGPARSKVCCGQTEICFRGVCLTPCPADQVICREQCCPKGFECVRARAGGGPVIETCAPKCPGGRTRCGFACCKSNWRCKDPDPRDLLPVWDAAGGMRAEVLRQADAVLRQLLSQPLLPKQRIGVPHRLPGQPRSNVLSTAEQVCPPAPAADRRHHGLVAVRLLPARAPGTRRDRRLLCAGPGLARGPPPRRPGHPGALLQPVADLWLGCEQDVLPAVLREHRHRPQPDLLQRPVRHAELRPGQLRLLRPEILCAANQRCFRGRCVAA